MVGQFKSTLVLMCIVITSVVAKERSEPLDTITLALKWKHQFQFAGYYAAVNKGFFKDEGLYVKLTTPEDHGFPVEAVQKGKAEYGVATTDILITHLSEAPVMVVASIFQHSPVILISRADSNLRYPSNFVGKKVMATEATRYELEALFRKEGVDFSKINLVHHTWQAQTVVNGEVDGSIAYISDFPFDFQQKGVEPRILRPIDYGIDFYGDILFTLQSEVQENPQRVAAVRRAVLRGWAYATEHPNEMIDYILTLPGVAEQEFARAHLTYEAEQTIELIQPVLVELGHSNPDRWRMIAKTYADLGMLPKEYSLEGFIYNPDSESAREVLRIIQITLLLLIGIGTILLAVLFLNRRLTKSVQLRTEELNQSLHEQIRQQKIFNALFDATEEGILVVASDGHMIWWNRLFTEIWKIPEEIMRSGDDDAVAKYSMEQLVNPNDFLETIHHLRIHPEKSQTDRIELKENRTVIRFTRPITFDSGEYIGRAWFFREITEQVQSEANKKTLADQLHQSQKMEAIGLLAGGVAHDINNALGAIMGVVDVLHMGVSEQQQKKYYDMILTSCERAAELTKKLLLFSRRGDQIRCALNCATTVQDTVALLKHTINKNITVTMLNDALETSVFGDESLLQNAFMNIGINASQAMPEGGELTFTLENVELSEKYCQASSFNIQPGNYLEVAIRDTGCGMSPEVQSHIFEPFFTTKAAGKGTGLGMAAVYGTVKEHGGEITVFSEVGNGTVLRLYLPITSETIQQVVAPAPIAQGSGTILVIDDEELIRITSSAMLESMGYAVMVASNGQEGVKTFSDNREAIDLILLDMIMPGMGGRETFAKLREIDHKIPIIIASGFAKEEDITELARQGMNGFLNKPFRRVQLAKMIAKSLKQTLGDD